MKDYRVEVKIKNNYLYQAMLENGFRTASELARACSVNPSYIGNFLNLKKAPINRRGNVGKLVFKLSELLGKNIEELFPPQHIEKPLKRNTFANELDIMDVAMLMSGEIKNPETLMIEQEERSLLDKAMHLGLKPRYEQVLRLRMEGQTLEEISRKFKVSKERIRQMEKKATRIVIAIGKHIAKKP